MIGSKIAPPAGMAGGRSCVQDYFQSSVLNEEAGRFSRLKSEAVAKLLQA